MKTVVKVRLGEEPEIKKHNVHGEMLEVVNLTGYVYDPNAKENERGQKLGIPVAIVAWKENAQRLATKKKGDYFTFVGQARRISYTPGGRSSGNKPVAVMGFTVVFIDETNTLDKQLTSLLKMYMDGKINSIADIEEE